MLIRKVYPWVSLQFMLNRPTFTLFAHHTKFCDVGKIPSIQWIVYQRLVYSKNKNASQYYCFSWSKKTPAILDTSEPCCLLFARIYKAKVTKHISDELESEYFTVNIGHASPKQQNVSYTNSIGLPSFSSYALSCNGNNFGYSEMALYL